MKKLEDLTNVTQNLITEINYIMKHNNRYKLTRTNITKLQMTREYLKKDLVYYEFMKKVNCDVDERMIEDKSNYINILSTEINSFKRLLQ